MFCPKCGIEIKNNVQFCTECGNKLNTINLNQPKVVLDPSEIVVKKDTKDSSETFSGLGRSFGICLMIISIILDLVGMFVIGFEAFIPITIGATVLFVIGFLMRMFCQ